MLINKVLAISVYFEIMKFIKADSGTNSVNHNDNNFIKVSRYQNIRDSVIRYPNRNNVRRQNIYPMWMIFPCINKTAPGVGRSLERPTSVHRLRPGDIDVIGAMGDSLVAGNGALEEWALGTMIENRGVSWCAGGQNTWREFLTVPNILKEFNPNITGYSTGTGEFLSRNSQMNVAYPVAADADAFHQAKILVRKMKNDPKINYNEDWKMVTVFFGANDICSGQCFGPTQASPAMHARKLMQALDYLQENMPRTFVNLIPVLDPSVSLRIRRSTMCRLLHTMFCSCFHQFGAVDEMTQITSLTRGYHQAEDQLVSTDYGASRKFYEVTSGRYDKRADFTVVLQPFMKYFDAPLDPARLYDEVIDISYITYDCFHFSQKGHALSANLLWNNLLQPVGRKSTRLLKRIMETFQCPTQEAPYLFTNENSRQFLETGRQ